MIRWVTREAVWPAGGILAVGLVLVVVALANGAPTSLDAFAAFVAVVGGIGIYALAGVARLALRAIRKGRG